MRKNYRYRVGGKLLKLKNGGDPPTYSELEKQELEIDNLLKNLKGSSQRKKRLQRLKKQINLAKSYAFDQEDYTPNEEVISRALENKNFKSKRLQDQINIANVLNQNEQRKRNQRVSKMDLTLDNPYLPNIPLQEYGGELPKLFSALAKGGYLKDKNTYVTKDGKETRRGLWANVYLKNKRKKRKKK